ncbi:MAG: RNA methyltransferase [Halobacteria archaeon]|nr:RNA methyltransferase [Halobacteria archaeon]
MKPVVVIVDPQTPGNVGTTARAMKNFGFEDLILVNPPELDPKGEAYGFAGQARQDILPNHTTATLDEIIDDYFTVGFTAVTNEDDRKHVRFPFVTPDELGEELKEVEARTALVFGREDVGLTNEELARLDRICSIPASEEYPVLNLAQAATIVLYELRDIGVEGTQHPEKEIYRADEEMVERFHDFFSAFLETIEYSKERRSKAERMMRRILGRAHPTGREITSLLGIFRQAAKRIERAECSEKGDEEDQK